MSALSEASTVSPADALLLQEDVLLLQEDFCALHGKRSALQPEVDVPLISYLREPRDEYDAAVSCLHPPGDTTAMAVRHELAFSAHLAVCFLCGDYPALCLSSAAVPRNIPGTCVDMDTLAGIFPGVCTALARLILCGDFKLGVACCGVVAAFGALTAWIVRVQSGSATRPRGRSCWLWRASFESSIEEAIRPTAPTTPCGNTDAQLRLIGPLQATRDAKWLARTSSDIADVLCAVLGGSQGPAATLWREKVSMLRNSLVLCIAVLDHCRGKLRGKAVDQCFVTVTGGFADKDVDNGKLASAASKRLTAPANFAVQQRLVEQLGAAVAALAPLAFLYGLIRAISLNIGV